MPLTARGDADLARPVCGRHRRSVATFAYAPQAQRERSWCRRKRRAKRADRQHRHGGQNVPEVMVGRAYDHRPNTTWRLSVDPGDRQRTAELSFSRSGARWEIASCCTATTLYEAVVVIDGVGAYTMEREVTRSRSGDGHLHLGRGCACTMANIGDQVWMCTPFPWPEVVDGDADRNPGPGAQGQRPMTNRTPPRRRVRGFGPNSP